MRNSDRRYCLTHPIAKTSSMIVLINGSFGVGKTTVARLLVSETRSSTFFDPEFVGLALQLPLRVARRNSVGAADFQNIALWRRLTILGAKSLERLYDVVNVPMAFTNLDYLARDIGGHPVEVSSEIESRSGSGRRRTR